jgi:hypothetical protein
MTILSLMDRRWTGWTQMNRTKMQSLSVFFICVSLRLFDEVF